MTILKVVVACVFVGLFLFGIISFTMFFISLARHFINLHEINHNQRRTLEFDWVELFIPKIILPKQVLGQKDDDDANQLVKWFWRTVISFLLVWILYAIVEGGFKP
jgi:hypothetical protein